MIRVINNTEYELIFAEKLLYFYELFTKENFDTDIKCFNGFENLLTILYQKHGQKYTSLNLERLITTPKDIKKNNNSIMVGFSSGLDSVYTALKLRDDGMNVTLFHMKGLNKNYPKESIHAKEFAEI